MTKRTSDAAIANTTETYKNMLVDKRKKVLSGLGSQCDSLSRMGRVAEEDQAQLSHDEFVSLQLNSLDYVQLRLVEEALDRLGSGHYGTCLACDLPIPTKRLEALPWARYCVPCQEEIGMNPTDVEEWRARLAD